MKDAEGKCFTGKIARLINCLNGFDENIIIKISDSEQISNIIISVKRKIEEVLDNNDNEMFKKVARKELIDRGYEKEVIESWIDNMD